MDALKKINSLFFFLLIGCHFTNAQAQAPRDGFYDRYLYKEKKPIAYSYIHEKDVFGEKRVWREIALSEKQNHSFNNPKHPFIQILLDAARTGSISAYSFWSDDFQHRLSDAEAKNLGITIDTIIPCLFWEDLNQLVDEGIQVVETELAPSDVKRIRLKEVWYFDEESGRMDVRILGIAPIVARYDDNGNFLTEGPLFWAYYPELRSVLAREEVGNGSPMTWEDIFEARLFSSYITKQSNVRDNRVKDIYSNRMAALLEADKIKNEHLNFEQGLWSY